MSVAVQSVRKWFKHGVVIFLLAFLAFGALAFSQAGTASIAFEAEDGRLDGQIQSLSDSQAAGGQAVEFIDVTPTGVVDFANYYPNLGLYEENYLEGNTYTTTPPSRSVLWFEKQDQWSFKMYNSAPEDVTARCHWDLLSWWDDGTFRYSQTHHECPGAAPNDIVYTAPIIFLPRTWQVGTQWHYNGSSAANYYINGQLRCSGTNNYLAEIIGVEEVAPGEPSIHWRTTQTTTWDTGDVQGGCFAGFTSHWQEDYWLSGRIPKPTEGVAKGLKRTKGGNLDTGTDSWDVWFDKWQALP